ncbi:DUF433 domain-containing protein [Sorangium sp. So ce448]|uniref:DUF433 domain-containing protein n=1 Tax=Sorangium sp. So ce448 TaxID=3133314 RepID=UPI003F6072FC
MAVTIEQLEEQVARLTSAEKARLLRVLAPDGSGIERSPGVLGGDACIAGTRIPVWLLESYRRLGWSEARILENFPTLRAIDLVTAWAYRDSHGDEIEQAIREHDAS